MKLYILTEKMPCSEKDCEDWVNDKILMYDLTKDVLENICLRNNRDLVQEFVQYAIERIKEENEDLKTFEKIEINEINIDKYIKTIPYQFVKEVDINLTKIL